MGKIVNKLVHKTEDVYDKILHAVDTIADPVRGTMSPKGSNVIIVKDNGAVELTNDGVTIAKNISVYDLFEDTILDIIKGACLKTNAEAGDGTSTTMLLTSVSIHEGVKLAREGMNKMTLQKQMAGSVDTLLARLENMKVMPTTDKELEHIARVSGNDDIEIAKNVVSVVKKAGEHGMVLIEPSRNAETEIKEEDGFVLNSGMFSQELRSSQSVAVTYENAPVFITDKRLYYHEEAESILETVMESGADSVVIIARDFIGEAINTFITNHQLGRINILLVQDPDAQNKDVTLLDDIATYVGGKLISDKRGRIVGKVTMEDFVTVDKIVSDKVRTIITSTNRTPQLKSLVKELEKVSKADDTDEQVKSRLAALTSGVYTIQVGGATPIETNERIYRYEDAVNATRNAQKYGYLPGGGVAMLKAFVAEDYPQEIQVMMRKYCEAGVRQIAENCGQHVESVVDSVHSAKGNLIGYNAVSGKIEDMVKAGVIDPYRVTEMAIRNSMSVASSIIGSGNIVTLDSRKYGEEKESS